MRKLVLTNHQVYKLALCLTDFLSGGAVHNTIDLGAILSDTHVTFGVFLQSIVLEPKDETDTVALR